MTRRTIDGDGYGQGAVVMLKQPFAGSGAASPRGVRGGAPRSKNSKNRRFSP